ncbi:outer membrane protein assembly factor BamD [Candidatus Omnitrophota bacterium]
MRKKALAIFLALFFIAVSPLFAYWIWTPESRKWTNPKYATRENPAAQFQFALELFDAEHIEKANAEFEKLIRRFPRSFEASEAQYYIGRCLEALHMPYKAYKAYQIVIDKYPFTERTSDIVERQFKIAEYLLEGGKRSLWDTIAAKDYPVVEILRAVINNEPYGKYAAAAYYKLGMFYKGLSFFSEAKEEFNKVVTEYPESEWVKPARYQIAFSDALMSGDADYEQEKAQVAQEGFEEFIKDFPDAELSEKAREELATLRGKEAESNFKIAQFYERRRAYESAKIYYQHVVDNFPETEWAVKSLEKVQIMESKL